MAGAAAGGHGHVLRGRDHPGAGGLRRVEVRLPPEHLLGLKEMEGGTKEKRGRSEGHDAREGRGGGGQGGGGGLRTWSW